MKDREHQMKTETITWLSFTVILAVFSVFVLVDVLG